LRKSVIPEHFLEDSIRDPQISALIDKIKLEELPKADVLNTRLKVIMKDGRELIEETRDFPKGSQFRNPLSKDEMVAKFWMNVKFSKTITEKNAKELLALLQNLEELDSVTKLLPLLVP
jgi:2-methylcitrate dehydratase PrpD